MKKTLTDILHDKDLHHACLNFTIAYGVANLANVALNSLYDIQLDVYNSIDHFAMGVGIGTLAYRKAGGGLKGIVSSVIAGTAFNATWEPLEYYGKLFYETKADIISDILVVYGGNIAGSIFEMYKRKIKD